MWKDKPFSYGQAWIDLILLANHKDEKILYKGEIIICERGTVNRSISELSRRWGWGREKTRKFLSILESDNTVAVKTSAHRTTITIENYAFFNDVPTTNQETNRQPIEQQTDNKPTTNQATRNKNEKNDKNNNIYNTRERIPPTLEEVQAYCQERGNRIDADTFYNFYESKGWMIGKNKMKDWKAAVRTWEKQGTAESDRHPTRTQRRFCETPADDDLSDLF